LGGRDALGDAAEDQDQLRWATVRALQGRSGEGVEDPAAGAALIVEHRGPVTAMDGEPIGLLASWAGQPSGVEGIEELGVAGILVHQFDDRKIHGRLRR